MSYIGWPSNVNKIILDATTVTVGQNATVEDSLSNGKKITRLLNTDCPDTYSVQMDFDWVTKDSNGLTEKDRFYNWYKHVHCIGVNPFEFPKIILGAESSSGETAFYKISAGAQGSKHGPVERFQMTFTEVFTGTVTIPEVSAALDHIIAYTDRVEAVLTNSPSTTPLSTSFTLTETVSGTTSTITPFKYEFDDDKTETLWFDESITTAGTYVFNLTYGGVTKTDTLSV